MNPKDLIDKSSWNVIFPVNAKRYERSNGCGICKGNPVGSAEASNGKMAAIWWPNGVPTLIKSKKYKDVDARDAWGDEIVGLWNTGNGSKTGAILWRADKQGALTDIDLHDPTRYTDTWAMAVGDGVQVGGGDPKTKVKRWQDKKSRGLVWHGSSDAIELSAPDNVDVSVTGTDGEYHVGTLDGGIAVLWRGDKSKPIELGPKDAGSEALAVRDGEQVGLVWSKDGARGALWKGSAASRVDLTPKGFKSARVLYCARGFQTGFILKRERLTSGMDNLESRAVLWHGSDAYLDLQELLPAPWNASGAGRLEISGDTLRICGTAQQVVTSGTGKEAYQSLAASSVVIWECTLRG